MAFPVNIFVPRNWPKMLGRTVDADGAFRFATCLAISRVLLPIKYSYQLSILLFKGWNVPEGYASSFFTECHPYNVDIRRVFLAQFFIDGGFTKAELEYGREHTMVSARTGDSVFVDVKAVSKKEVKHESYEGEWDIDSLYGTDVLEVLARGGDVSACITSKKPYRYWWQAFNRAMHKLMGFFPHYTAASDYDTEPCTVWPYVLGESPDGMTAKGFKDLLTPWRDKADAEKDVFVREGEARLMTPADINFSGVFRSEDENVNPYQTLRFVWRSLAKEIGFMKAYEQKRTPRWRFEKGLDRYWRGETEAKFSKKNRLLQLSHDWKGEVSAWRDEFPYHGLSAMIAYLDYFEQKNVGYAIRTYQCDKLDDFYLEEITITNELRADGDWCMIGSASIPADGGTVWEDLNVKSFFGPVKESHKRESKDTTNISASVVRNSPQVMMEVNNESRILSGLNLGSVDQVGYNNRGVWRWERSNGGSDGFEKYLECRDANAFAAWINARLRALCESSEVVIYGAASWVSTGITSHCKLTYASESESNTIPVTREAYYEHVDIPYIVYDGKPGGREEYYFLRTTKGCRIAKMNDHGIFARVEAEVDMPGSYEIPATPPGNEAIQAKITAVPMDIYEVELSNDLENEGLEVYSNGQYETTLPLPIIRNKVSGQIVFPPTEILNPDGSVVLEDIPFQFSTEIQDSNKYPEERADFSYLESIKTMQIVKYSERVLETERA